MKIAISANGRELNATVDPRFGRCQQFLIVDTDTTQYDVLDNPNIAASGGAGIQTAQLLASKDVQAVITGNCGPNAFMTLEAAGIQVFIGATGSIQDSVEQYKQGKLQSASQANVAGHFGDQQRGMGQGQGQGRGRGRGRGRQ